MGLATGLTLSDVSVAGLLGISESSSYSLGSGSGVCCWEEEAGAAGGGGAEKKGSVIQSVRSPGAAQ